MNQILFWLALAMHVGMMTWPLVLFRRADRERVRLGLVAAVLAVVVSLWRFSETPPGVCCMDQAENMHLFYTQQRWAWLWLEERAHVSQGFGFFPTYLANLWLGNFYGERIVGLIDHVLLVLGGAALLPRRGLAVGLALLAVSPTVLWHSRHYEGTNLLLAELGVIGALGVLRCRESLPATLAAGLCLGFLSWCYMPARVTYVFPALWLWRRPTRAFAVYGVLAFCLTTLFVVPAYTGQTAVWRLLPGQLRASSYRIPPLSDVLLSLRSLVDSNAGTTATVSYRGTQTLPWLAIPLIAVGSVGSTFGVAGLVALAPDLVSTHGSGRSGRQMFAFLPFVFAAARPSTPPLIGVAVAGECLWRWARLSSPMRSMLWKWPNGYSGLDPCNHVKPQPSWCPKSADGNASATP